MVSGLGRTTPGPRTRTANHYPIQSFATRSDASLADKAYTAAFDAEPTNAEILWERAQNLRQSGKLTEAQRLYRQLAEGDWQPRFNSLKSQAKWQVEKR